MQRIRFILGSLALTGFAGMAHAATFTGSGFNIFDNAGRLSVGCSTVAVSGFTGSGVLSSVTYKGLTHTSLGDLELRVYLPGAAPPPSTTAGQSFVLLSPPDSRPCDLSGDYRFIDSAAQSLDVATDNCGDASVTPAGDYRSSSYGGGTADGPTTSLASSPGVLTSAQVNGTWLICAFDTGGGDAGAVTSTQLVINAPTAAKVLVTGQVLASNGSGLRNTVVSIQGSDGKTMTAVTNAFGYFQFSDVELGNYVLTIASRQYKFGSRVIAVQDSIADLKIFPVQ